MRCFPQTTSIAVVLLAIVFTATVQAADDKKNAASRKAAEAHFAGRVLPLLKKRCFGCHGDGKELEGKLDLRTRKAMLKGGENGPALVPGKPEKSAIYTAVLRTGDLVMPPKERNKLSKTEIATLKTWIKNGAIWSTKPAGSARWDTTKGITVATSGGLSAEWTNRKYNPADLWAYRPIKKDAVPKIAGVSHPVDAFIRRKLNERKLKPSPPADRRTLIRRLTFDLTGLPPTPQEIDAFVKDKSPQAYEKLVDRLLASQRYGEQQARHWLDVVRYADTAGFSNDFERPNAWRYRDYVIRSFNNDKPFDRFILEQLAGDELPTNSPPSQGGARGGRNGVAGRGELNIAVGFLRMGPWEHTGMSVAAVTRQQYLDDITNSVGVTFLAHGLRCAKCHDHKFDPIPTRDYYRIQSVFAPVQFADRTLGYLPSENVASLKRTKPRVQQLLNDARKKMAALRKKNRAALAKYLKAKGVKKRSDLPEKERPPRHYGLTKLEMSIQKIYFKRIAYFAREMQRYQPLAFSVYSGPPRLHRSNVAYHPLPGKKKQNGKPQPVHILAGGSLAAPKDLVTPGVLSAVAYSNDTVKRTEWNTVPNNLHGRRLAFAKWIASPKNTLTARVIVNRIWQQHFGRGIVETPNNFGRMGGKPSHPQLLDWLARWFIEHNWSIKKLHKLIVTSATYQQQTSPKAGRSHPAGSRHARVAGFTVDPKNRLLWRYPSRRLTAEELRDAMLAVTGELNTEMGGPGVYPEINWEVAKHPRHIMGSVAPAYQPSRTPAERNRRTIYAFRIRSLADPMLEVFNRPNTENSCERRNETTVTPQAFALFNGQFAHDRALALAASLAKQSKNVDDQIRHAFRRVYGRLASKAEITLCRQHIAKMTAHHRRVKPVVVKPPTSVKREMVEELTGETFTWHEQLDLMKTYVPDLKPWQVSAEVRGLAELCLVLLNSNEFVYVR